MPVRFTAIAGGRVQARVPGVRAVGEARLPLEALATLALLINGNRDQL
jgi:hypothetical protein